MPIDFRGHRDGLYPAGGLLNSVLGLVSNPV
jgi:hypothetical protein